MKTSMLTLAMLLAAAAARAENALTMHPTELRADAQSDAATLATLPQHAPVEVLSRRGAWSEVRTASGQRGWVRIAVLKTAAGAPGAGAPGGALDKLLSTGRTSNTATVTTGVRGLPREERPQAQGDPDELLRAREFARDKAATQ